jgi:hypothetical protein
MQNPNPKPKPQIKPQIVEFLGDERLKEDAIKALEYYVELLRDYLGAEYEHCEPHYHVKITKSEIIVRYMRVLRVISYRDVDGKTRRKVEKVYWSVRAHVS